MKTTTKNYSIIAFCGAIIAVLAQITIPIPVIPLTMQTLAVGLISTIIPWRQSVAAVSVYVIMGAIGLPVYANFTGGVGILFGPTGGFLLSFVLMAFVIGYYQSIVGYSKWQAISANLLGMLINLIIGTVWLKYYLQLSWIEAFMSGFVPFIVVGVIKAVLAASIGLTIRIRLLQAKLMTV
jgi:biotin transport system substrate-specific component